MDSRFSSQFDLDDRDENSDFLDGLKIGERQKVTSPHRGPKAKKVEPSPENSYIQELERPSIKQLFDLLNETIKSSVISQDLEGLMGDERVVSSSLHPFFAENKKLFFHHILGVIRKILERYQYLIKITQDTPNDLERFLKSMEVKERVKNHLSSFDTIKNRVKLQRSFVLKRMYSLQNRLNAYTEQFLPSSTPDELKRNLFTCQISEVEGYSISLMNMSLLCFDLREPTVNEEEEKESANEWVFQVTDVSTTNFIKFDEEIVKRCERYFNLRYFEKFENSVVSHFRKQLLINQLMKDKNIERKEQEEMTKYFVENERVDLDFYYVDTPQPPQPPTSLISSSLPGKIVMGVYHLDNEVVLSSWFLEKTRALGVQDVKLSSQSLPAFQGEVKVGEDIKCLILGINQDFLTEGIGERKKEGNRDMFEETWKTPPRDRFSDEDEETGESNESAKEGFAENNFENFVENIDNENKGAKNQIFSSFNNKYLFYTSIESSPRNKIMGGGMGTPSQKKCMKGVRVKRILVERIHPSEFEKIRIVIRRNQVFNELLRSCFKNFSKEHPFLGHSSVRSSDNPRNLEMEVMKGKVSVEVTIQDPFSLFFVMFMNKEKGKKSMSDEEEEEEDDDDEAETEFKMLNIRFYVREDGYVEIVEKKGMEMQLDEESKKKSSLIINKFHDVPLFFHFVCKKL